MLKNLSETNDINMFRNFKLSSLVTRMEERISLKTLLIAKICIKNYARLKRKFKHNYRLNYKGRIDHATQPESSEVKDNIDGLEYEDDLEPSNESENLQESEDSNETKQDNTAM